MHPRTSLRSLTSAVCLALPLGALTGLAGCNRSPAAVAVDTGPAAVFVPPLCDAKVGEELMLRRGATAWRWRIASADSQFVGVEVQEYTNDVPAGPLQAYRWSRNGYGLPDEFVVQEIARDRISVADVSWDCWRMTVRSEQATRWYWVTDALPVHGVLRIAVDLAGKGAPDLASPADYVAPTR